MESEPSYCKRCVAAPLGLVFDGAQFFVYSCKLTLQAPDLFERLWGRVGDRAPKSIEEVAALYVRPLLEEPILFCS